MVEEEECRDLEVAWEEETRDRTLASRIRDFSVIRSLSNSCSSNNNNSNNSSSNSNRTGAMVATGMFSRAVGMLLEPPAHLTFSPTISRRT
jgi:hypothetical protein